MATKMIKHSSHIKLCSVCFLAFTIPILYGFAYHHIVDCYNTAKIDTSIQR